MDGIQDATQTDWLAEIAPRAQTSMQTTSHAAALAAAKQGGGLVSLIRYCGDNEPGLVRLETPPLPSLIPSAGMWLAVHKDNRDTPRLRVALDHIRKWVRSRSDELDPAHPNDLAAPSPA